MCNKKCVADSLSVVYPISLGPRVIWRDWNAQIEIMLDLGSLGPQ